MNAVVRLRHRRKDGRAESVGRVARHGGIDVFEAVRHEGVADFHHAVQVLEEVVVQEEEDLERRVDVVSNVAFMRLQA